MNKNIRLSYLKRLIWQMSWDAEAQDFSIEECFELLKELDLLKTEKIFNDEAEE